MVKLNKTKVAVVVSGILSVGAMIGVAGHYLYQNTMNADLVRVQKKLAENQNKLAENLDDVVLTQTKMYKALHKMQDTQGLLEARVTSVEEDNGKPLGYYAMIDVSGDGYPDRLYLRKNGSFIVEVYMGVDEKGNNQYSFENIKYTVRDFRDLIEDYLVSNKDRKSVFVAPEQVDLVFSNYPETICHIKKLAIDSELLTTKTQFDFLTAFNRIDRKYKIHQQKIEC